ncbi:ATP-binding protein [Streptomyces melanosporofaciens]|uniref:ATP-binding protein n=1 Tax=unclassified Streptomyces TaxID=2593676 RepID=UPI0036B7D995
MSRNPFKEPETPEPDHIGSGSIEHRAMSFARREHTAPAARGFITEALTQWQRTERIDDIRLCASELATNALLHGASEDGLVLVRIELHDALLRLEVHDSGDGTPTMREPQATADDGRGLLLISAVADNWGVDQQQGPGKCVWATFEHSSVPAC